MRKKKTPGPVGWVGMVERHPSTRHAHTQHTHRTTWHMRVDESTLDSDA